MQSKLINVSLLAKNKDLCPHLPVTRPYTQAWLRQMVENHDIIYVKPDCSLKGIGVIRIDKKPDSYILGVQDTKKTTKHTTFASLWNKVNDVKRKQSYLIQQGVCSLTLSKKPFDIRVHLLRVNGKWLIGGMIGKIGKKESIVTNGCAGASPMLIDPLLTSQLGCSSNETTRIKDQLKTTSIHAATAMKTKNPSWCEFGLDIGIDANRHIWIYEINSIPGATGFKEIDRPSYLRICSLRKKSS